MYLSRVKLDTARRGTMAALAAPQRFHGAVESAFPGPRARRLWRLDKLGGDLYLLLVSEERPQLQAVAGQFGFPDDPLAAQTRDYAPFLDRLRVGSRWHFRLTANPTRSVPNHGDAAARGAIKAHCTPEYQGKWLRDRAETHGFSLKEGDFAVTAQRRLRFQKGGEDRRTVYILSATFEGVLTVTDAELFKKTLIQGIGRGKAYGQGLLTIAGEVRGNG